MLTRRLLLLAGVLALSGCKDDDKEKTKSALCSQLLECISLAQSNEYPVALQVYGPDSPCWKDEQTAASCEAACRSQLQAKAELYPETPQCRPPATDAGVGGDGGSTVSKESRQLIPLGLPQDVDLLFVIDNSDSMKEEQDNLAQQFPRLIDAMRNPQLGGAGCSSGAIRNCNIPNVRIGVISSDLGAGTYTSLASCQVAGGDQGALQTEPRLADCSGPTDPWIEYLAGQTNVASSSGDPIQDLSDAFRCIGTLGRDGCGFEHQLEAARRALDPALNVNPGFLRDEALLAVVFITDEDDCSAERTQLFDPTQQGLTDPLGPLSSFRCFEFGIDCDVGGRAPGPRQGCQPGGDYLYQIDDYARFWANLKPEGQLILFAIAGPTNPLQDVPAEHQPTAEVGLKNGNPDLWPSCESAMGKGVPAIRIQTLIEHSLLEQKGQRGYFNGLTRAQRQAGTQEPVNICRSDFGPALQMLGEALSSTAKTCLIEPPLTAAGSLACHVGQELYGGAVCQQSCLHQASCQVEEVTAPGTAAEVRTAVERCPSQLFDPSIAADQCQEHCPCWRLVPSADCQATWYRGSPYALEIMRTEAVANSAVADLKCTISGYPWGSAELLALGQCE